MTSVAETPNTTTADSTLRAPLSRNQQFICMFDKGDDEGPFGPQYSVNYPFRIEGEVDTEVLQAALDEVAARHEALCTQIVRGDDPHQRFLPPGSPKLIVRELPGGDPAERDRQVEQLLIEIETSEFSIRETPLLRAVLGRFDERDAVLVLVAHHSAADGWSMQLIMRDLVNRYAARRGHAVPDLPVAPQYREFVTWEQENDGSAAMQRSREYWREKYQDIRMLPQRTDFPRSAGLPKATAWHRFLISGDEAATALAVARELRATPFMVFLAAYELLLHEHTGESDIALATLTAGRTQKRFHDTVGNFYNFLPVRADITGCQTFRQVAERTRTACLESFKHEMSFMDVMEQTPHLMSALAEDDLLVGAFQVLGSEYAPDSEVVGDLRYSEVRRRLQSQDEGIDVPEGALWTLDVLPSKEIVGSLGFNSNRWSLSTMAGWVDTFCRILRDGTAAPDAPLSQRL